MAATASPRSRKPRTPAPSPDSELAGIGKLVQDYRSAKLLFVAVRLDLFTFLEDRTGSVAEICSSLRLQPRPAEIFLNALVALGFLVKRGGRYSNPPRSSRFLVRGKPEYFGHILKFQDILWPAWDGLEHILRTGAPEKNLEYWMKKSPDFTEEYIRGMARIAQKPAREVAARLRRLEDSRLLDIGAGPGVFSLAMLDGNPRLQATLLDLPGTLRLTEDFIKEHPGRSRIRLQTGDYRALDLEPRSFDIILLSHMTHNESPSFNKKLIAQCFEALRPGGRVAVHDFMLEADGVAPAFSALFAAHMMTFTEDGAVYRAGQYEDWLRAAGFGGIRSSPICAEGGTPSVLLVGAKI